MLKLYGQPIYVGSFPDGTLHMKVNVNPFTRVHPIVWKYENDAEIFHLACLVSKIHEIRTSDSVVTLTMPYIPHARMDRVKDPGDVFTLQTFAEMINSMGFSEVNVLDPHSSVSAALIHRIRVRWPMEYIDAAVERACEDCNDEVLICYPDEGSMKRYSDMIRAPYVCCSKKRNWATGVIEGLTMLGNVEDVAGRSVLIVDDICSRGGTFFYTANRLKEVGAENIYLYATHCENTVLSGNLLEGDLITRMYTTDSLFSKTHPKIEVIEL